MQWVSRVVRGAGGRLQVKVEADADGVVTEDIDTLRIDTSRRGGERRKGVIRLAGLTSKCAGQYLRGLGLNADAVAGQPVYETDICGTAWRIPSQVLVLMLFGSRKLFRERLLTPSTPSSFAPELAVAQTYNPALQARLRWMTGSPSAVRAWASVYRNALEGRLEMSMPDATIEVSAQGREVGGAYLVVHARLLSLQAHDMPPASQLADRPSTSDRPPSADHGFRTTVCVDGEPRLQGWTPLSRLSDAQWTAIRPHVAAEGQARRGAKRRHDPRLVTEAMLTKLAGPLTWADVPGDRLLVAAAANLFQKLRHERILETVIGAATSPC